MNKKTVGVAQRLEKLFHPSAWRWKHYVGILGLLLGLNLFGPKGIIHWVIVEQEVLRLEAQKHVLEQNFSKIKDELNRFETSDVAKIRAIQEDLGYLTNEEVSFEFTDAIEVDAAPAQAR